MLLVFALGALAGPAQAAASTAPAPVVRGPLAERIDGVLRRMSAFDWSGSILLEKDGEVVLRRAYGFADRPAGRAHDVGAVFDVGSLAKQFTAAAVLRLEEDGKLSTGDALARFFPDAPADKAGITLAQLLAHSGGIAGDFPVADPSRPFYDDVDEEEAVARILARPLEFAPGSSASYSNCGYILLASVVQRASGRRFQDYVRDELWRRAGMRSTGFWGEAPPAGTVVALGHDGFGRVVHDPARMRETWYDLGGGEVWSTLDDLRAWVRALSGGEVLAPETLERMLEPRARASPGVQYAWGWHVLATPRSTRHLSHGGDYLGCGDDLVWLVDEDVLWITSTNVRHDTYPTRNRVDRALQDWIFERKPPPDVPDFVALDAPPPAGLEGEWRLASGGVLRVERIRGRLYVGALGQDATDALAAAQPAVEEARAWRSRAALATIECALRGGDAPDADRALFRDVLGAEPNPEFARLLAEELAGLVRERGELSRATLLGSFATGWPHGNPQTTETTLVRLDCTRGDVVYAIRWTGGGREIAWTETVEIPLACAVPLQLAADGSWAGWKIVEAQALRLRSIDADGSPAIEVEVGGRTTRARRAEMR